MDDEKYEISYHEFHCPLCHATISTQIFYQTYEKGSRQYVDIELEKERAFERFVQDHYETIHGVKFPEMTEGLENDT